MKTTLLDQTLAAGATLVFAAGLCSLAAAAAILGAPFLLLERVF